ncbi:recombinase family protein [Nocardiopsis terrae]
MTPTPPPDLNRRRIWRGRPTQRGASSRPDLKACLAYLCPGDTLVGDLRRAGVGFRSLHEALDTTTPGGRLVFHVFAALAELGGEPSKPERHPMGLSCQATTRSSGVSGLGKAVFSL